MGVMISSDTAWQPVEIGAGGWITGMDIARDGTMVARADTYGAYIWNGTSWVQLVTASSMPADVVGAGGVYEIRVAPSDSNIIYMEMDGGIFKSVDKGAHWAKTAFPSVWMNPNSPNRMDGEKMAVDPNNPNIVFAGTQQNGLYVTHDGGTTWQQVAAVPRGADAATSSDPALTGIVFDTSGGSINGGTRVVYAATAGSGVYRSTDGGSTWIGLAGGPKDVAHAVIGSDGSYYATGNTDLGLWKYANGSWTQLLSGSEDVHAVSVDPFDPAHIIAVRESGNLQESHDGGHSWSGWNWTQQLESSSDVPWLENSGGYMSSGEVVFDPLVQGRVWQSAGVGVWSADLPPNLAWNTALVWNSHSVGIEQLVANDIIVPSGDNPLFASGDRAFFEVTDPNSYATSYSGGGMSIGWSLDYASTNPRFVVGLSDGYGTENSGFSADGGHTWQKFAGLPAFAGSTEGGSIAASSPTNIIWAPAGGYAPAYTTDGGTTWKTIALPGKTDWSSFHSNPWYDRTTVTADRVQPNTFYLYDVASGVYVTHDGGASWTKTFSGEITPWSQFNAKIEAVPGRAGELFFTAGSLDNGSVTTPADSSFMHSTDGGATWQAVAGVKEVYSFGYGAPATAGGPATVYIVGWVNGEYGVWYSTDDAQHWSQIGRYPTGSLDFIKTIAGDMDEFGSVYIGFAGSGYAHLSIAGASPPVAPPLTANPTQTAVIVGADDNVGSPQSVSSGALINDSTPTLNGSLSSALSSGQFLAIYRDGQAIGQLTTTSTTWSYTDPGVADGTHNYAVRVEDSSGRTGASSRTFTLSFDTAAPLQQVTVLSAVDDAGPSTGTLQSGAITDDISPLLRGTLSYALGSGETLAVFRDGLRVGAATVSSGSWSFADANVSLGAHIFTARVEDAAGNAGTLSTSFALSIQATNLIFGTTRSDVLTGTAGNDRLSGIPDSTSNLGKGTIDVLTGNGGADLFVLGDARGRFYEDGKSNSSGTGDYARITDFGSDDHVQLRGMASSYFQSAVSLNGVSGTGIFHDSNGNGVFDARDELIGLVQNHGPLDASSFIFV